MESQNEDYQENEINNEKASAGNNAGRGDENDPEPPKTKLFVGHIPEFCHPRDLEALFSRFGSVVECDIIKNYGFVHMSTNDEAQAAVEALNNYTFKGTRLRVEASTSRVRHKPKTNGFQGGGGGGPMRRPYGGGRGGGRNDQWGGERQSTGYGMAGRGNWNMGEDERGGGGGGYNRGGGRGGYAGQRGPHPYERRPPGDRGGFNGYGRSTGPPQPMYQRRTPPPSAPPAYNNYNRYPDEGQSYGGGEGYNNSNRGYDNYGGYGGGNTGGYNGGYPQRPAPPAPISYPTPINSMASRNAPPAAKPAGYSGGGGGSNYGSGGGYSNMQSGGGNMRGSW